METEVFVSGFSDIVGDSIYLDKKYIALGKKYKRKNERTKDYGCVPPDLIVIPEDQVIRWDFGHPYDRKLI